MTTEIARPFVISLRDAALKRLQNVEWHVLRFGEHSIEVFVALPVSYAKKTKQRYPLVIVNDARAIAGSAIEMSRLMAQTKEIRETVLVGVDVSIDQVGGLQELSHLLGQVLLPWCRKAYRTDPLRETLFGAGLESVLQAMPLPVRLLHDDAPVASLVHGLRDLHATGHQYGLDVMPLANRAVTGALAALRPAIGLLWPKPSTAVDANNPYLIRSEVIDREYEVFAALPASWTPGSPRRYPALFVLDANIEFSTVAEAAARLAGRREIQELVVVGIGAPRREGALSFGFRRFEEFSPPSEGYGFDDALGRFFRSFFAIRGQDARGRMGLAPQLFAFLSRELLPKLLKKLPIDADDLGLLGHSAAGTFVGYALCQESSPFRRYVAVSPGIGISGNWLMKDGRALARKADRVCLSLGGEEKRNRFNGIAGIPLTEAYAERLRREPKLDVRCDCFDGETHSSVFPRAVTTALGAIYDRSSTAKWVGHQQ